MQYWVFYGTTSKQSHDFINYVLYIPMVQRGQQQGDVRKLGNNWRAPLYKRVLLNITYRPGAAAQERERVTAR